MKPLTRQHVSKHKSASKFRQHAAHTKGANLSPPPMRGGIRL
jgi:hypothetical protein